MDSSTSDLIANLIQQDIINLNGVSYKVLNCTFAAVDDIFRLFMCITLDSGKIIKISAESIE